MSFLKQLISHFFLISIIFTVLTVSPWIPQSLSKQPVSLPPLACVLLNFPKATFFKSGIGVGQSQGCLRPLFRACIICGFFLVGMKPNEQLVSLPHYLTGDVIGLTGSICLCSSKPQRHQQALIAE